MTAPTTTEPSKGTTVPPLPEETQRMGNNVRASWNFSADDIRANIASYEPEAQEALMNAFLWCIDPRHPVSKPIFAQRVGSSDNTVYKLLAGKYLAPGTGRVMGPSAELVTAIQGFLEREKERVSTGERDFVMTPTAESIIRLCNHVRESRTIGFLVGPSHVGKTWTLERHYAPQNNHGKTPFIRMPAASGLGGMVRAIAAGVGVSDKSHTAALIERTKNALTADSLLILDECHLLAHTYRAGSFHNCMEVIREIHDVVGCGMVLCFTLLDDVKAASQKELQQLWRRGVHKLVLPAAPGRKDVAAILAHHGLEFPDRRLEVTARVNRAEVKDKPFEILRQIVKAEALKAVTERVRYAKKLAGKNGAKLEWKHFVAAHVIISAQAQPVEDNWNDDALV